MAVEWDPLTTTAEEKEAILEAPVVRGRRRIASRRVECGWVMCRGSD